MRENEIMCFRREYQKEVFVYRGRSKHTLSSCTPKRNLPSGSEMIPYTHMDLCLTMDNVSNHIMNK